MIRSILLGAAVLMAAPAPVQGADARLVTRLYDKDEVVRVEGRLGVQATIAFAEDEHIENVAIGDSATWQVTPNKRANLLFVKPLAPRARTNLTVVTDRHAYYFDLVAGTSATPLYVLRFTYPEAPKPPAAQLAATGGLSSAEARAIAGERPVDPAALNFAWRPRGAARLLPSRIYDDGTATYLSWSTGVPLPAILMRDEKGTEGPVNFAARDDVIVVDGVPPVLILRSGRDMAAIERRADAPKIASGMAAGDAK